MQMTRRECRRRATRAAAAVARPPARPLPLLALLAAAVALSGTPLPLPVAAAAPVADYDVAASRQTHGAYLGCFAVGKLGLEFEGDASAAAADGCRARCAEAQLPLYAVSGARQCACTARLPDPRDRLDDGACEAVGGSAADADAAAAVAPLFYIHADDGQACALMRTKFDAASFDAAFNPGNAQFSPAGDAVTLRMDGHEGTRVEARGTQLYGLVSFKARASADPGVITAAYLRSEDGGAGGAGGDGGGGSSNYEEVDVTWLNGAPADEPGTLWLSAYHRGQSRGEARVAPAEVAAKLGREVSLADEAHTYAVDWQPGHVAWYLDGAPLYRQARRDGFELPDRPMRFVASIWSDAARGFQFGGTLDYSRGPFASTVAGLTRVTCAAPLGGYNGPNWLHGAGGAGAGAEQGAAAARKPQRVQQALAEAGAGRSGGSSSSSSGDGSSSGSVGGSSEEAPLHVAYLGCFDSTKLPGLAAAEAVPLTATTVSRCPEHCAVLGLPIYALSRAFKCACTALVPDPGARLEEAACEDLTAGASGGAVPLYYLHALAGDGAVTCAAAAEPLAGAGGLAAAYNARNLAVDAKRGAATLALAPGGAGVRAVSGGPPQRYGMVSFKGRFSGAPGVLTAVYLRSDRHEADAGKDFDEIGALLLLLRRGVGFFWGGDRPPERQARAPEDEATGSPTALSTSTTKKTAGARADFLFINGAPAAEPGTLWVSAYASGRAQGEAHLPPSNYTRVIGARAPALSKALHTYAVDWQPTHVAWYLDGKLLAKRTANNGGSGGGSGSGDGAFAPPSRPMHLLATIWTDAARGFKFGGKLDASGGAQTATLTRILRVACEASGAAAPALGPAWARNAYMAAAGGDGAALGAGVGAELQVPEGDAAAAGGGSGGGAAELGDVDYEEESGGGGSGSGATEGLEPLDVVDGGGGAAATAAAASGVYLGCFDGAVLQLDFAGATQLSGAAAAAGKCLEQCRALNAPVYAVSRGYQCLCLADAPHPAARLPDDACERLQPGAPAAAPLFYIHSARGESCSVARVPPSWDAYERAAGVDADVEFDDGADSVTLRHNGLANGGGGGVRIVTKRPQQWGMLSFKAKVAGAPGVVTTASLRSGKASRGAAGGAAAAAGAAVDDDEISVSFLSGPPAHAPGSLWLGARARGAARGDAGFPPALYGQLLGQPADSRTNVHAYTVDWQPGHVAWYMDGALLLRKARGDAVIAGGGAAAAAAGGGGGGFEAPARPLAASLALWSDDPRKAAPFGGRLDAAAAEGGGAIESTISNVLRVSCSEGAPPPGPSWLAAAASDGADEAGLPDGADAGAAADDTVQQQQQQQDAAADEPWDPEAEARAAEAAAAAAAAAAVPQTAVAEAAYAGAAAPADAAATAATAAPPPARAAAPWTLQLPKAQAPKLPRLELPKFEFPQFKGFQLPKAKQPQQQPQQQQQQLPPGYGAIEMAPGDGSAAAAGDAGVWEIQVVNGTTVARLRG